jgi:hypothetical protein
MPPASNKGCDCYPSASSSTLDLKQVTSDFEIFITWSTPHPEMAGQTLQAIANNGSCPCWMLPASCNRQARCITAWTRPMSSAFSATRSPWWVGRPAGRPAAPPQVMGRISRVLGHYCRERKLFSLETAIHKMTGLSASRFALDERGLIRPVTGPTWCCLMPPPSMTQPASKHRYSRTRHCRGLGEWHAQLATHGHRPRAGRFAAHPRYPHHLSQATPPNMQGNPS